MLRSSDAANVLTLAGPSPTITVNALGTHGINKAATISAEIAGSGGFTKAGVGVLSLTASNSYSGLTTVSGGNWDSWPFPMPMLWALQTLALGGSNTYSGATLVSNGTLLVNGRHIGGGEYAVASGATLGGTGLISAALASASGGVVAPGNSIGTMTFNGDADLGGILKIELDSSGFGSSDLLVVTGSLDISSATLDLDLLAGPLDDDAYILAQYGVLAGTFASILDAPGGYQINYAYNGNQIALVIPEPPGFSLILMGSLAMALRSGRKRAARRGILSKGMPSQAR